LVIGYNYLWSREAAKGQFESSKARPAAIVMVVEALDDAGTLVSVLPITHSPPGAGTEAIEIPPAVARIAGLDDGPSWVVTSEFNEFIWPGFDVAIVPGRIPRTIAYGYLPPVFLHKVRAKWLQLDALRRTRRTSRDD
jgi:hypothetical protein